MRLLTAKCIWILGLFCVVWHAGVAVAAPPRYAVPSYQTPFQFQGTMDVMGKPKERLYLHIQHPDTCKDKSTDDECKATGYIITGDSVPAGDTCDGWTEIEYRGKWGEIYAWVDSTRLADAQNTDYDWCTIRLSSEDWESSYKESTPKAQRDLLHCERERGPPGDVSRKRMISTSNCAESFAARFNLPTL